MIIKAKLRGVGRVTYPDLATAINLISRTYIKSLYLNPWLRPLDPHDVQYYDEYDIPIPMHVIARMVENLPKPKYYSYPTISFGYKRGHGKWFRRPKTMNSKRQGVKGLPSSWDDLPRACNYDRSWKSYRKTQYK